MVVRGTISEDSKYQQDYKIVVHDTHKNYERDDIISGQISASESFQCITGFNAGKKVGKWCSIRKFNFFNL